MPCYLWLVEKLPDLSNLPQHYGNAALIRQVAAQLQKDFGEFSFEITFEGSAPTPYDELFPQVKRVLEDLLERHFEKLMALLYRIDISEEQVGAFMHASGGDAATDLAHLILERELKKVLTRNFFSAT